MASLEEIREDRLRKIDLLKEKGIDPYPARTNIDTSINDVLANFESWEKAKKSVFIGGRIMALRSQGGLIFFDIFDGTGRFQALLKKEDLENNFDLFDSTMDIGDFVEAKGTLFVTKKGQQTLEVKDWNILSKSLRPLPEKWAGLQDTELRLRQRYLDFLTNAESRDIVIKKAKFWKSVRDFLVSRDFLEVETPILETTTGGADAKPFVTHHNALDMDVYLRISAGELWQKELMVAGFPKVFEIGRIFRNEGISPEHAQDYTQMEFYWSFADYKKGMKFVEELYKHVAKETFGTTKFDINGFSIDLDSTWEVYDYMETIKSHTGVDVNSCELSDIEDKLEELQVKYDKKNWNMNRAVDTLWKQVRKKIAGPGFLVGVPKILSPLAKTDSQDGRSHLTERFQPIIAGSEIGNGYSELNDPIDQRERFESQQKLREAGDSEAQMFAHDFIEALEYGMPPTCGFGMSERLFSFLMNKPIRETQLFPLMKPK